MASRRAALSGDASPFLVIVKFSIGVNLTGINLMRMLSEKQQIRCLEMAEG